MYASIMKKTQTTWIKALVLAVVPFGAMQANSLELYLTEGYRDGGKFEDYYSRVSYSLDGAAATGLVAAIPLDEARTLEIIYNQQSTSLRNKNQNTVIFDANVNYLHVGGTNTFSRTAKTEFFGSGGLGATHFSPDNSFASETRFSLSVGAGVKHAITNNLMLRLDGKLYGTLMNSGSGIFCGGGTGGSGCSISVSGSLVMQYEVSAGIGFKF